jgi:hypothetical protein
MMVYQIKEVDNNRKYLQSGTKKKRRAKET